MAKTYKKRSSKRRRSMRSKPIESTMHGLDHWHENVFEKLGWMVLAKEKGYNDKVTEYKHSVMRLKSAIENKLAHIHELDRKDDLQILHNNVSILLKHIHKDF